MGNDTILEIRLSFKFRNETNYTSGYIKLDSIPNALRIDSINFNGFRGMAMGMNPSSDTILYFRIYKNMLPRAINFYHDIIISAHFICNPDPNYKKYTKNKNPILKMPYTTPTNSEIDTLKIDVTYKSNNCPVAIDWIKL